MIRRVSLVREGHLVKRSRFDAASFPTKEDVGMPKKYDAATRERAVRMFDEQASEYASVTAACAAVAARLGLPKPGSTDDVFGVGVVRVIREVVVFGQG
jgi:hypothetical protein